MSQQAAFFNSSPFIDSNTILGISSSFSAACWLFTFSAAGDNVVMGDSDNFDDPSGVGWFINIQNGNSIFIGMDGSYNRYSFITDPLMDAWHFIVLTYDAPTATITFYFNGVSASGGLISGPGVGTSTNPSSFNFALGAINANNTIPSVNFDGLLEEVQIYNYALSSGDVSALYNSGKGVYGTGSETGLVSAYHLNGDANAYKGTDGTWNGTESYVSGKALGAASKGFGAFNSATFNGGTFGNT